MVRESHPYRVMGSGAILSPGRWLLGFAGVPVAQSRLCYRRRLQTQSLFQRGHLLCPASHPLPVHPSFHLQM